MSISGKKTTNHIRQNLRIRTQLFLLQLTLSCLTITLFVGIIIPSFFWILRFHLDNTTNIFIKDYLKHTDSVLMHQIMSAKEIIIRSKYHLIKSDFLYQFLQTHNISLPPPYDCLTNYEGVEKYQFQQTFCYGFFGDREYPRTEKDAIALKFSSLLTEMLPVMDLDLDLLFSTVGDQMYFSIWPGDPFPGYKPHRRIWYTNHLDQIELGNQNATYFSDPYILWTWFLFMITQTRNMTGWNGSLDGVLGSDLNFSLFSTFKLLPSYLKISLIDEQGTLMLSQLELDDINYIQNESLTGITEQTFQNILNQTQKSQFSSDCRYMQSYLDQRRLCRYNNLSKTDELIMATSIQEPNLIIVIQANLLYKKHEIEQSIADMQQLFTNQASFYLVGGSMLCLASLILGLLTSLYIFSHLSRLISFTDQHIYKDTNLMKQGIQQKIRLQYQVNINNAINELHEAFQRMRCAITVFRRGKTCVCKIMERIQYPQKCDFIDKSELDFKNQSFHSIQNQASLIGTPFFELKAFDFLTISGRYRKWLTTSLNDSF